MKSIYKRLAECERDNIPAACCTIISTDGSTPRKSGSKMIVFADKSSFGSVGGGALEHSVIETAAKIIQSGKAEKLSLDLSKDQAMECGGAVEVYIEPLPKRPDLYIMGAGHVGAALARIAIPLGFHTILIDHRKEIIEAINIPEAIKHCSEYNKAIKEINFGPTTFIVIVTPKHLFDEEVLEACIMQPNAYIGMMGSRNKIEVIRHKLEDRGIVADLLDKVDMPIGIPIKSETPEEIAISIMAKLIDVKNSLL